MANHSGSCSCGKVLITAMCEPEAVSMCHCLLCQKRTGSTYSLHGYFPSKDVHVEGTTRNYSRTGDSGAYIHFRFCPECGSTVCREVEASPGKTGNVVHTESTLPGTGPDGKLCMWPVMSELPAVLPHPEVSSKTLSAYRSTAEDRRHTLCYHPGL